LSQVNDWKIGTGCFPG